MTPDFKFNGMTPYEMADILVNDGSVFSVMPETTYHSYRTSVRNIMKRVIKGYGTGSTMRHITSAVLYELSKRGLCSTNCIETYAEIDIERYQDWLCSQELPVAPANFQQSSKTQTSEGEVNMIANQNKPVKLFTKVVFINGRDASTMSDDDILAVISAAEAEINRLAAIEVTSSKILKRIEKLEQGLAKVVRYLDNR